MSHLLAKRLNCVLDERLLCVNVELSIFLKSQISELLGALCELVEVLKVSFVEAREVAGDFFREGVRSP